jgi:hypothetical protein
MRWSNILKNNSKINPINKKINNNVCISNVLHTRKGGKKNKEIKKLTYI